LAVRRWDTDHTVIEDVDWWVTCINDADVLALDRYSRFAYLAGALAEFRTLVHFRLSGAPLALRVLLRRVYRPAATLALKANRIGPALFIQHGLASIIDAEEIGSHCWINQQVTIGHTAKGRPRLGDRVRVGAGAVVVGPITLHDGVTIGVNATVVHDVAPGETLVAPLATALRSSSETTPAQPGLSGVERYRSGRTSAPHESGHA
jgi:serine O-acetyltransferase